MNMEEKKHYDFLVRLLKLIAKYEIQDEITWHGDLSFRAYIGGLHFPGSYHTMVTITEDNIDRLEQCLGKTILSGVALFICEEIKKAPHPNYFKTIPVQDQPFFKHSTP